MRVYLCGDRELSSSHPDHLRNRNGIQSRRSLTEQCGEHGQKRVRNIGTVGPASQPVRFSSEDASLWWQNNEQLCKEALHKAGERQNRMNAIGRARVGIDPTLLPMRSRVRYATCQWLKETGPWNIGLTLHFPDAYRHEHALSDGPSHARKLRRFLNHMDRVIFRNGRKRKKMKLKRSVFFESSPTVGWHAHVIASYENPERALSLFRTEWNQECIEFAEPAFKDHVFDGFVISGGYLEYSTKECGSENAFHDVEGSHFG